MKILCVIQCTNLGGMEQCTLLLLEEWQRLGIECEVLSLNPVGELGPLLEQRGIPVSGMEYRGKGGWRSFLPLRRRLRETRADAMIMVGHNLMAMLALGSLWKEHRLLAQHYHHEGVMPDWQWRLIYRVVAWRFSCVLFPSAFIMDEAVKIAPFLKRAAGLIDNPFPIPALPSGDEKAAARLRLNVPAGAKVIGNAGWLIARKRWDVFLDVAARVARASGDAFFLIAGDGPERAGLEAQARALGIEDRVRWLGWQKDLTDFYRALDVMLFNADWDAMPRAPLEAMSHGVPVVASVLHGGTREMINADSVGICLPSHDLDALAAHILRLLSNVETARQMGLAGRERVAATGDPGLYAQRNLKGLGFDPAGPKQPGGK
jgi:glycosyltransferase involved in cell wall biosynthesis